MSFLSRLFKKQEPQSNLEIFVKKITEASYQKIFDPGTGKDNREETLISGAVFLVVKKFYDGLDEMVYGIKRGKNLPSLNFDAIAFECLAYSYAWLMRDFFIRPNHHNFSEEYGISIADDEEYFHCLSRSSHIADSLLEQVMDSFPYGVLHGRIKAYSLLYSRKNPTNRLREEFASFLISSIQSGSPAIKSDVGLEVDLALQLAVMSNIPIFESTLLVGLDDGVRRIYLEDIDVVD